MKTKNSDKIIYVVLLLLALPFFLELCYIIVPPSRLSFARYITPSFEEYLVAVAVIIGFVLLTYFSARISSRILFPFGNSKFFLATRGILKACTIFLPLFSVFALSFIFIYLKDGLFEALLAFRFNNVSIGYFGYSVLFYYPIVLAVTWSRNNAIVNSCCLVILACSNLLTGFRSLLISSFLFIFFYNFNAFNRLSLSIKLVYSLVLTFLFVVYGNFRASLELSNAISLDTGGTFVDSLNRSFPIRFMVISFRQDVSATFSNLLDVLISPFSVLIDKAEGVYDFVYLTAIQERLVRGYLVWRGTPTSLATGISIHIIPYSLLFYGIFGFIFFASLLGFSLGIGVSLSRFQGILSRVLGVSLITFVISCTESFQSAFGTLCYQLVFLLFLFFFSGATNLFLQR